MTHTKMGKDNCPACNYLCDSATPMEGEENVPPNPGDVSICLRCGEILEYAHDMALQKITPKTIGELEPKQYDLLMRSQNIIRKKLYKKPK